MCRCEARRHPYRLREACSRSTQRRQAPAARGPRIQTGCSLRRQRPLRRRRRLSTCSSFHDSLFCHQPYTPTPPKPAKPSKTRGNLIVVLPLRSWHHCRQLGDLLRVAGGVGSDATRPISRLAIRSAVVESSWSLGEYAVSIRSDFRSTASLPPHQPRQSSLQ